MADLFSEKTEKAVLGLIINKPKLFKKIDGAIVASDFYFPQNQSLYKSIKNSINKNGTTDQILLIEELKITTNISELNWSKYITELITEMAIEENLDTYISLIKEKKQARDLSLSLKESVDLVSKNGGSISELIGSVESKIFDATKNNELKDFNNIGKLTEEYKLKLYKINKTGEQEGLRTKISSLDEKLGGLKNGEFIVIAARPSMGKTAFSLEIAKNVAQTNKVGFFSLEMPNEQLIKRLVSSEIMLNQNMFNKISTMSEMVMRKVQAGFDKISKLNIWIDDTPALKISELAWKTRKLHEINGLDLVIVDYIQLIETGQKTNENRQQVMSDISRQLKSLAREINIPIIVLSQLSRRVEQREEKRPQMSDIRESGAIEQDADIIMFLYREDYYKNKNDEERPISELEVIISKHRNGPTGIIKLGFDLKVGKISSLNTSNYKN